MSLKKWICGNNDYGIIQKSSLPFGEYVEKTIKAAPAVKWSVTSNFSDVAKNHCGAVTVLNLASYFKQLGYQNLIVKGQKSTFKAVHKYVKNGPVLRLFKKAKRYFNTRNYLLTTKRVKNFDQIKTSLNNDEPVVILLVNGLFSWHWVLVVGYIQYPDNTYYLQVMDNWYPDINRYYKPYNKAYLVLAKSCQLNNND